MGFRFQDLGLHCLDCSFGFKDRLFVVIFLEGLFLTFRTHFLLEIAHSPRRGRVLLINSELNSKGLGLWGLGSQALELQVCSPKSRDTPPPPPPRHPEP